MIWPEDRPPLVFDASVAINFLGTGMAKKLLSSLARPVFMAEKAFAEIERHPIKECDHRVELDEIISEGHLIVQQLGASGRDLFYELASKDILGGLDDGEAATIALAITMDTNAWSVLDDQKAKSLSNNRWPSRNSMYTVDLLLDDRISRSVAKDEFGHAIYTALRSARMRVPVHHRQSIVELIGNDRAKECPSLGFVKPAA